MCNLALREYNELNAVMPLVLFEDAMKHVCKVTRIIAAAQGHALMVGVGGSGRQSLSKSVESWEVLKSVGEDGAGSITWEECWGFLKENRP